MIIAQTQFDALIGNYNTHKEADTLTRDASFYRLPLSDIITLVDTLSGIGMGQSPVFDMYHAANSAGLETIAVKGSNGTQAVYLDFAEAH